MTEYGQRARFGRWWRFIESEGWREIYRVRDEGSGMRVRDQPPPSCLLGASPAGSVSAATKPAAAPASASGSY